MGCETTGAEKGRGGSGRARTIGCVLAGAGCFLVGVAAVGIAVYVCVWLHRSGEVARAVVGNLGLASPPGAQGVPAVGPGDISNLLRAVSSMQVAGATGGSGAAASPLDSGLSGGDWDFGELQAELGKLLADPAVRKEVENLMSDDAVRAQMRALLEMGMRASSVTN